MSTPIRRSGRERKRNPRYEATEWDKEILRALRASSESSGSSAADDLLSETKADTNGDQEDHLSARELSSFESAASNSSEEDEGDISEDPDTRAKATRKSLIDRPPHMTDPADGAHSRGILRDVQKRAARFTVYNQIFGPNAEDLADTLRARDTWLKGRDVTIPSRRTLSEVLDSSTSPTVAAIEGHPRETPLEDSLYRKMSERQSLLPIGEGELATKYLHNIAVSHLAFLGPAGREQSMFVRRNESVDFGKSWGKQDGSDGDSRYHQGWLLNLGERVQCLAWAPSDNHRIQYLAVTVRCTSAQRQTGVEELRSPEAFRPSPPYTSTIQIWGFKTQETRFAGVRTLDMHTQPKLSTTIATDWGNIRQLRWRPAATAASQASSDMEAGSEFRGILGVLSSDGHVRMLAISIPQAVDQAPGLLVRARVPGYDTSPAPNTIFTAFSFLTPTDVVAGAADGSIHVFDLTESVGEDESATGYIRHVLHKTYTIAVASASVSDLPHIVASVSAAGDLVLVDLRSPEQDRVSIHRACFPNRDLVYSPFTHSFITALDRAGNTHIEANSATFIMCHHIRQFNGSLRLAKLPDYGGTATALAASRWHPCILAGNSKGTVTATNFLRKILRHRPAQDPATTKSTSAYMQVICEYEWRALTRHELSDAGMVTRPAEEARGTSSKDLYYGPDVRPGASRFREGFKPEQVDVAHSAAARKSSSQMPDLGSAEPIFEEEQAVTAIEWNVNARCASLVAIGWGSGLLRVQDLSHEFG